MLIGFLVALIIQPVIQPGARSLDIYAALPLGTALCFALYLAITRKPAVLNQISLFQRQLPIAKIWCKATIRKEQAQATGQSKTSRQFQHTAALRSQLNMITVG